jgi:hypothetical protein
MTAAYSLRRALLGSPSYVKAVKEAGALLEIDESKYCISGFDVRICAPPSLQQVLSHVDRDWTNARTALQIDARFQVDSWYIAGTAPDSKKILGHGSALPQVAGAVVASLIAEIAYHRDVNVWRAAVVERHGKALVLAGNDWESCVTLAAHLRTRGWRLLGGDYALVTCDTLSAAPCHKKALHANSSSVASFPLWYRPAVEASPRYSCFDLLEFYAIDPTMVGDESPWAQTSPIRAFLKVDGHIAARPAQKIEVATLVRSDFSETCDFIERWFVTLAL